MEAPVCALVDAMFRLPAKIDGLLVRHGHLLPRGAADEISLIKQDLENMVVILQEHHGLGGQDRAMMVKCLTKEVRELSYDIEDSVDQYEHSAGTKRWILSPRRKEYKITSRGGKTAWRLWEKLKWRLWMANKIREFSVRSQEALQHYSLLNHPGGNGISSTAASTSTRCDPSFSSWHPTPYGEPVGIDAPLKKIEAWLDKNEEQKLKVVSVVGSGGVGKTTLANELYRGIGGQFECRAFVRMSRKADVRRILISMLSQVRPHHTLHTWKVHSLIADIRTHLQDKRYLIVIDDIWDKQTWDIINRALPDGNLCSGILITTEVEDVALKCCGCDSKYIFMMKPLGHDDSRKLFLNTAFGPKYECSSELSEVANSIIRKCAGLPLAMVIVANILASHMCKPEQWDYVNKSLGCGLRTDPTSAGMMQVLSLSYNNLPQHLKPCMMYLSIYKEDFIIQKDDLVKQWVAEGLICETGEKDKEEISRSYFDELICSRMIQPVHINDNDDIYSCTVHSMVLDFVTHKSIEENFVTAIDDCQTAARFADKVRRLSLHFGNAEATAPTNMRLSQLRTLAFFGVFRCLPSIVEFGLLRVLILHLWGDDESVIFDLTRISELFRLRYLHIICNVTLEVQKTQIDGLQYLETMKIDARMSVFPSEFFLLPGLLHLTLPVETDLPNGIGHMASLCTLGYFDLCANSVENVQSLSKLTNLRDLRLTCSTASSCCLKSKMDSMGSILVKLSNLRTLTLEPSGILDVELSSMSISCDAFSIVSSAPVFLRRFEWLPSICTFSSLPQWIGHLNKLCILKIGVTELASNDVEVLRGLPALTVLSLYVQTKPAEKIVFNKTGFSVLKYFMFGCRVPCLEFKLDAMPKLLKLKLGFDAHGVDQDGMVPIGMVHLTGLKEISAKIWGASANDTNRGAAESALIDAIKMHPAQPTFNIQCLNGMFSGKDDNNSGEQKQEHITLQNQYDIMEEDSMEQQSLLQKGTWEGAHSRFSAFSDWKTVADKQPASRVHHLFRIGERAGLSSSRKWTTWLKTKAQKYKAMEEGSNIQHGVLQTDYMDDTIKQAVVRMPKRSIQMRVSTMEDGFIWRYYGQKEILGSKHRRCYYRCTNKKEKGCQATKQVHRSDSDPEFFDIVYHGEHTCVDSVHSRTESAHSLLHHLALPGLMTSGSLVTYEAVSSSSTAGTCVRSPGTSAGSQVTNVGVSRTTLGVPMSQGTSENQVTHQEVSVSTHGFWSVPNEVDSIPHSLVDDMLDVDDYLVDDIDCSDSEQRL
uniref:Uncharacterized protein n=1 Tax=Avena sativa TaxID=4498 RepID=A0ACD5XUX8_AVESA